MITFFKDGYSTRNLVGKLGISTSITTPLEGEAYKRHILFSSIGVGITSEVSPVTKKALFTSLAYDELYMNKPSKLYKIIDEYVNAGILTLFGLSIDKYLELSTIECSILVDIAYKLNKDNVAAEEAALKVKGV